MKKSFFITLLLSITAVYSAYADSLPYGAPTSMLEKINPAYFKDPEGRVIYYPCNMGGEPLVIYSSIKGKSISSKSTLYPIYLEKGFQASPIQIPDFEMSEQVSHNNLVIQTINPAAAYVSINLSRQDGALFYVDTANFPIVDTI